MQKLVLIVLLVLTVLVPATLAADAMEEFDVAIIRGVTQVLQNADFAHGLTVVIDTTDPLEVYTEGVTAPTVVDQSEFRLTRKFPDVQQLPIGHLILSHKLRLIDGKVYLLYTLSKVDRIENRQYKTALYVTTYQVVTPLPNELTQYASQ